MTTITMMMMIVVSLMASQSKMPGYKSDTILAILCLICNSFFDDHILNTYKSTLSNVVGMFIRKVKSEVGTCCFEERKEGKN